MTDENTDERGAVATIAAQTAYKFAPTTLATSTKEDRVSTYISVEEGRSKQADTKHVCICPIVT